MWNVNITGFLILASITWLCLASLCAYFNQLYEFETLVNGKQIPHIVPTAFVSIIRNALHPKLAFGNLRNRAFTVWPLNVWSSEVKINKKQKSHILCDQDWVERLKKNITLKTLDTFGNCQRPHLVNSNMGIKQQTCENFGSIVYQSCKRIMKEKHPYCTHLCAFRCIIIKGFSWIEAFYYSSEKLPLFQKL